MESLARTAATLVLAAAAVAAPLTGTFALLGGTQHIVARAVVSHLRSNEVTLDIVQSWHAGGPAIVSYDADMTKLMHVIAIRDDFRQFMHLHPSFDRKTGTFHAIVNVDPTHAYNVYADSEPKGAGQQVFRFTVPADAQPSPTTQPVPPSTPSPSTMNAGPYTVKLARTTLSAGSAESIPLDITKAGRAASDLRPYLGAAGHAVFINTATLEYVHVHPLVRGAKMGAMINMDMDMAPVAGPHLVMYVPALPVGTYKLWFQFRGAGALYVAPFTLAVR